MKIRKIKFQNIHSLYGENELDFTAEPLSSSGIYAITGSTGSGKSSILDAMTLALYGKVNRYDTTPKENIISYETTDCYSEVEFEANSEIYTSKWAIKRANNKINGKLQDPKIELFKHSENKFIDIKLKELEATISDITGLDYNRFLRSVMLAQNDFQAFLFAKQNEKADLLEKITGIEIYSQISIAAFERSTSEKNLLVQLETEKQNINLLKPDEINEFKLQIDTISKRKDLFSQIIEFSHSYRNVYEKIAKDKNKKQNYIVHKDQLYTKINELKTQHSDITSDIEKHKIFKRDSLILFEKVENKDREINRLSDDIVKLKKQETELKNEIQKIEDIIANDISKEESLQDKKTALEDYLKNNAFLISIQANISLLDNLLNTINENKNKINEKELKLNENKDELQAKSELIPELEEKLEKYKNFINETNSKILELKEKYEKLSAGNSIEYFEKETENTKTMYQSLDRMKGLADDYYNVLSKKRGYVQEYNNADMQLKEAKKLESECRKQLNELKNKIEKLDVERISQSKAANYTEERNRLVENEPCPLCGSIHHPYITDKPEHKFNELEAELKKLKNEKASLDKNLQKYLSDIATFNSRKENNSERIIEAENNLQKLLTNFATTYTTYTNVTIHPVPISINDTELIKATLIDALNKQNAIVQVFNELKNIQTELTKLDKDVNTSEKQELKINSELSSINSKIEYLNKQITNQNDEQKKLNEKNIKINNDALELLNDYKPKCTAFNSELLAKIKKEIQIYNSKVIEKEELTKQITELINNININKSKFEFLKSNFNILTEKINDLNSKLEFNKSERYELFQTKSVNDERSKLEAYEKELAENEKKISSNIIQSKTEIEGLEKSIDELEKELLQNETLFKNVSNELEKNIALLNDERVSSVLFINDSINTDRYINKLKEEAIKTLADIDNKLQNDEKERKKFKDLEYSFKLQQNKTHFWEKMSELIGSAKGDKFKRYAQQLTLNYLISLANRHLVKLNPRYMLFSAGEYELEIIDKDQADNRRTIKSLSGGETFLVSLALALALSEIAGRNNEISSLFIDEGFGSLDNNSLESALSVLENLQLSGKKIGIISHVSELKERIAVQIQVNKHAGGRSVLKVVLI